MPNYSARDMLLRMAEGGEATYGKYGQTAADLLAAEQRILGEIAASPDTWDVATAYNAILESGVTVDDALAAGVKQSTIDAIFTSGAPLPVTAFSTPSTVTSAFESAPYAGQSMEQIRTGAQNYVSGLMADGLTDAERREAQAVATQQGATFQDMLAAGVDPSILFNVPAAKEPEPDPVAPVPTPFPQTQPEYVPPTVYQPIAPQPDIYAPGEEALDREFRDSAPRTEVTEDVMGTQRLTGFDYTPAAKLLSATGSGFSFTPPSVTSRPRSLMDTGTLNRYTQGRAAQDLRQLTGADYDKYSGLLNRTGSYGGGLSRSQLYALTRQQDSQRPKEEESTGTTGTISDYLRLNEDVGMDYAAAKAAGTIPAGTTLEGFGLNHYNTYGRAEIAAGKRAPFTLAQAQGGGQSYTSPAIGQFGEGDEESRQSNFTTTGYDNELLARDLGPAGGAIIRPVFAEGGLVKKPEGFADGGPADSMTADELTAQLMAMDSQEAPAPVEEPRPTDQVQTESQSMLDNLNRAMSKVTQPVVAAATDMTVGLGDLAQMGVKAAANKMGIETKPFIPVGENIKASVGANKVSPLNPIYMATQILPFAKLQKALAAGPAAYREAMAYLAGEGGAQVAATQFPDSMAAQLAGAVTGDMSARGILDTLDGRNVRRITGDEPPIDDEFALDDGPLLEGEPEGTVLGISDQSESDKMLKALTPEKTSATPIDLNNPLTPKVQKIAADRTAREQDLALLEGDIKKKRVTVKIDDLARAIDQDHVDSYGRKLDPTLPEDQDLAAKVIASNIDEQMTKETTGAGWYDADVEKTFTTLSKIPGLEALQNNESLRVLWSALAAPTSIGLKVNQNAKAATAAMLEYVRTGKVPTNPPAPGAVTQGISGAGWGPKGKSVAAGMKVISTLVDKYGVDGFADWWLSPHTLKELTDVRKEAGLKSAPSGLSGGRDSMHLGSMILGDKTGRFSLNINGYEGTTKDVWYTRSYNRAFGQMFGNADEVQGGPRNQTERREMEAFNQKVLDNISTGQLSEADAQAILWFYEQGLYSRLGVSSRPGAFSEGVEDIYETLGVRQPIRGSDEVKIEVESPTGLENYRGIRPGVRAIRANRRANARLDNGSSIGGATGPYSREVVGTDGGTGLLNFTPDPAVLRQYETAGNSLPAIRQVDAASSADTYNADMTQAMAENSAGAQVEIKSAEDLSGYNLFRTEAGSGFAIKPDGDIVAVFASPNEPPRGSYAMLQAAVQAGGTKLDAFDTFLPKIYENAGFRPVARLPWNDEFAPDNWDKKVFAEHNNGEPDIVFFVHDPEYFGGAKDVPVATDYDDAVRLQDEALGAVTPAAKSPEAQGIGSLPTNAPQTLGYDAEKIAKLPRVVNDPVAQRFNEQVGADPEAAIAQYRQLPDSKGGKVLNTDFFRELSPDYRDNRTLSSSVQETSNALNELMYQRALRDTMGQDGQWVFTGGGAASGKTAGLPDDMIDSYDLVVDGTLANFEKSSAQIDQALDSGKAVTIIYVDRPPEKALPLLLGRANKMEKELGSGRTVPLDIFLGAHRDARESIKKIENKYKNDDRVAIQIVNNHGAEGKQFLTTVDKISEMDYNTSLPKINQALEDAYEQGKISESIYLATKGNSQPRPEGTQRQAPKDDTARNAGNEPKLEQGNQVTALNKSGEPLGINIAVDKNGTDYADLIVSGTKKFESRETASLKPYVGKRVGIVRTGAGPAEVIGSVEIGQPIEVNEKQFNQLRDQHLVAEDSSFNIKKGQTKFLYPMVNPISTPTQKVTSKGIVARALPAKKAPTRKNKVTFEAFGGSLGDARQKLGITQEKIEQFKAANKGTKQEPVPKVMAAAKKLKAGEISTEEYNRVVEEFQPIKPLGSVQKRPTNEQIAMALTKNEADSAGIVGVNLNVPDGTMISSRLDIPAYENMDTWVVTLHDGTIKSGRAVGYAPTAVLNDVEFYSNAAAALKMATKDTSKGTIARINGSFENRDPAAVEQLARDILDGTAPDAKQWVEVGMNPFRHSYFYRKSDGMPVANAEQVLQVGPLVLAKKIKTRPIESPEHLIKSPKGERYFKSGGSVERVYNDNRTYK